jgi:hypothetical protein
MTYMNSTQGLSLSSRYGKTPSAKARVNILKFPRRGNAPAENEESNADTIVAMIIAVAKGLPVRLAGVPEG